MSKLFGRSVRLTIDKLELSELDLQFKVTKNLKPEPNTCDLRVYNIAPEHRKLLEKAKKLPVRLEAGYGTDLFQVYLGEVRGAHTVVEGPDIVTVLTSGDSEKEIQTARINVPLGPGASVQQALTAIARTIKVGTGNIASLSAKLASAGLVTLHPHGGVLSGDSIQELTDFCSSAGLEWSIQDGQLQILNLNKPLDGLAFEISSQTGLVGSPTVDTKGIAKATCLLTPGIRPGVKVAFKTLSVTGGYRVIECEYTGDRAGNDWYVEVSAKKY